MIFANYIIQIHSFCTYHIIMETPAWADGCMNKIDRNANFLPGDLFSRQLMPDDCS